MDLEDQPKYDVTKSREFITVEWGTTLMLRFKGFSESHKSTLVGMERGIYLICKTPAIPGIWAKLRDLNQVVVRYMYEGVVYGFQCTLLSLLHEPFHLLILSYPQDIETVKLRKSDRINCLIPAVAKLDGMTLEGTILDLSEGGCALAFAIPSEDLLQEIQPGSELALSMQIPGLQGEDVLMAETVNVRRDTRKIVMGCRFQNPGSDSLERAYRYMEAMAILNG